MSNNISAKVGQVYSSHVTSVFIMLTLLLFIWLNSSGKLKNILTISSAPSLVGEIPGGAITTDYGNSQSSSGSYTGAKQVIYNALIAAGFTPANAETMTAISGAESHWSSAATANTSKEYSVGPFQINLKAHPYIPESEARNPVTAAQWAYKLSGGANFTPWTTYTSGAYKQYLP
jgi:hypothetical protein